MTNFLKLRGSLRNLQKIFNRNQASAVLPGEAFSQPKKQDQSLSLSRRELKKTSDQTFNSLPSFMKGATSFLA